ncbi:MAG: ABC transporter permease [Anaerolineales bacterium]|nr:ABC transporter permease [Anaerolineales bacterium]MCS7246933.1 ABC transporter permease [Anaerolineales bacterium]MDW8160744.1 ABC transporter permease [Anaerolineales bacterium]MDW8447646.1 ABC transporter permease [Anaerolineales bacterium]
MAFYLATKEIIRNWKRFFLFSLVIALITILVLFIAALAEGLAEANKEYLEKLNAELIVFQKNVDLSTAASRIPRSKFDDIQRVEGVAEIGPIGFATATIVSDDETPLLDVSLIGVEPGKPGMPPVFEGLPLRSPRGYHTILDQEVATQTGFKVGDRIKVKTIVGSDEKFYTLEVVGITDGRKFFYAPSIFVPFYTWNTIKPQPNSNGQLTEEIANVVAVRIESGESEEIMAERIQKRVSNVEVVDRKTAYEASPGYQAQQGTLNTQRGFTLLIGILVIGGFFQIQTLQKVPQIGVLKAIGASNQSIALAVILQIVLVTLLGVIIGSIGTLLLAFALPEGIPILFNGTAALVAVATLLLIGPIGGMVSVRLALKIEPLAALRM